MYRFRTVFDLGTNPTDFFEYWSEDICFFSSELEECVAGLTSRDPTFLLEELLWDFLPAEEQAKLSLFRDRGRVCIKALSPDDRAAIDREVHLFDRRRLFYLRYGAIDQSRIFRLNPKLFRPLLGQSRDEREYYFIKLEKDLSPHELKTYVFAIFDLQRHFTESFSATMPEALNQTDISDHFIDDLCNLSNDHDFWHSEETGSSLHDHLVRYLIMFFDYGYGRRSLFDDFLKEFMGRHRAFRWPDKKPDISVDESVSIFGVDWQSLSKMNKRELTKLYRKRAKELHPDTGGTHKEFVTLNKAYAALVARKK